METGRAWPPGGGGPAAAHKACSQVKVDLNTQRPDSPQHTAQTEQELGRARLCATAGSPKPQARTQDAVLNMERAVHT